MKNLKIISWNVNGIRAVQKKGFIEWVQKEDPDILCLQETKANKDQLDETILNIPGYHSYWHSPLHKKGYSGTATFTKFLPLQATCGLESENYDMEGRTLRLEFKDFILYNIYFPNGKSSTERLNFKMGFYEAFQQKVAKELSKGKKILICGDINTAHKAIDLARPKENEDISGFLPIERAWIDRFLKIGFHDTLRIFKPEAELYTWWSMQSGARRRNVGWRIDYFYASQNLKNQVIDAFILPEIMGSDHCPIGVILEVLKSSLDNENVEDISFLCGSNSSKSQLPLI